MKLSIRQFQYVCEVADSGSIRSASATFNISPSSILAAIAIAETEISAPIFTRKASKGMFVTPLGEQFIAAAREVLVAAQEFDRSIERLSPRQEILRVGCYEPISFLFFPQFIGTYRARGGSSEIELHEGSREQIEEWLAAGNIDLAIFYDTKLPAQSGWLPICRIPPHALLHASDPLAAQPLVALADLIARPLILPNVRYAVDYITSLFERLERGPECVLRTKSYEGVCSAVASGLGYSIMIMKPIGSVASFANTVRIPIIDDIAPSILVLADNYGKQKPKAVQQFADMLFNFFEDLGPSGFSISRPSLVDRNLMCRRDAKDSA